MSKTVSGPTAANITDNNHLVRCFFVKQRISGTIQGFTVHDKDIPFDLGDGNGEVVYQAASAFNQMAVANTDTFAVDNTEIEGILDSSAFDIDDVDAGKYDRAEIKIFLVDWTDLTLDPIKIRRGHVGEITTAERSFKADLRGLLQRYTEEIVELYSPTCRVDLGDTRCGVRLEPPKWTATTAFTVRPARDARLGSVVKPATFNDRHFKCTTAGTSGGTEPSWNLTIGGTTSDGSVTWTTIQALTVETDVASVTSNREFTLDYTGDASAALLTGGLVKWIDAALTLSYNFRLKAGSSISDATVVGPNLTFTRATGDAAHFDENAVLVKAAIDVPRFDHDPVTGAALDLLIEGQRENVCLQSEDLSKTWNIFQSTETVNQAVAPDGNTTADEFIHDTGSGDGVIQNITVAADTEYTVSIYIKANGGTWLKLQYSEADNTNATNTWFNLVAGTVGTGTGAIQDVGGGWFRVSLSGTIGAAATNGRVLFRNVTADNSNTIDQVNSAFSWGMQLEAGSFPTSYIKTTTAAVIRSADVDSADISGLLGVENTLVISARTGFGAGVVVQIDDGTESERYRIERKASNELLLFVTDFFEQFPLGLNLGTVADNTDFKLAIRLAKNNIASSLDGAAVVVAFVVNLPTVDTIRFGMGTSGDEWNGTIAEGKLFNVGKPNNFLQSIAGATPPLLLNTDLSMEVKQYAISPNTITLFLPMPFDISVGDPVSIQAGCLKTVAACRDTFDNIHNFQGEPYVPGVKVLFRTPNAQ